MLSTTKGQPVLTYHRGTPGGSGWAKPGAHSANTAANLGELPALQWCLSYQSRAEASPSFSLPWIELEMGGTNPLFGRGWPWSKA